MWIAKAFISLSIYAEDLFFIYRQLVQYSFIL